MKLGLGTVQFGLAYGVSNPDGITGCDEVKKILSAAGEAGVRIIDTAHLYGKSEAVLGEALLNNHGFSIVTKTPKFTNSEGGMESAKLLEAAALKSLSLLRQDTLYGLLVHNADDLCRDSSTAIFNKLQELKERGIVEKIGVSVYNEEQIDYVTANYNIDLIQLPMNVFDQRLLRSGALSELKMNGVEIHVRSAFLQGLLLMETKALPKYFNPIRAYHQKYMDFLSHNKISPIQGALGFLYSINEVDSVVCGVNNVEQFVEIANIRKILNGLDFAEFAVDNIDMINPVRWDIRE